MKITRCSPARIQDVPTCRLAALAAGAALALAGRAAAQSSVAYDFATGDQPYGSTLAAQFTGQAVTGRFEYDPAVPATGTSPAPPSAGATVYQGALQDLAGTVAGHAFGDPSGRVLVGDDRYDGAPGGPYDILVLAGDPGPQPGAPPALFDFAGFDIAGYRLQNARLFWIEVVIGGGDFLSDQSLPAALPAFAGRLALDFAPMGATTPLTTVFFDLLTVVPAGLTVEVDVKPGDPCNRVNPRAQGLLPVALRTTSTFDALSVDVASVTAGPFGAAAAHERGHAADVDGDGDLDLVLHFWIPELGLACGDTWLTLEGRTWGGQPFGGTDAVVTVGCR